MDWSVGQILQALKDTGVDNDTLVIFTSDNGPWLEEGVDGGHTGKPSAFLYCVEVGFVPI